MNVVPLYLRTEYSLLQSTCRINALVSKAKAYGYHHLALTDEGNMHGTVKFYRACIKHQIKPIIGLKVIYHYYEQPGHLLLYAMNNLGYQNLMKIASRMKINDGWVEFEYLQKTSLGIIAVTPGSISSLYELIKKNQAAALQHIRLLESIYDYVFVGISRQTMIDSLDQDFINFCTLYQLRPIALDHVFYIDQSDKDVYLTLKKIKKGIGERLETTEEEAYLKTPNELKARFEDNDYLLANLEKLISLCRVTINFDQHLLPQYYEEIDVEKYLRELSLAGLKKRLQTTMSSHPNDYLKRLDYELSTITAMGFTHYFLIVWDFIRHAKKQGIYVGPGRGSAPASLVSYCLGITDIDPLMHQLLFERFLNRERITMPDIDIDFPDDERDQVIQYVGEKYGPERVAHIVTFGTFALRLAIRDVAKVFQLTDARLKEIFRVIGKETANLEKVVENNSRLQELMAMYEDINQVIKAAIKIEGLPKNTSTHAAGIVMTKDELVNYTPLEKGLNGIFQTQYEAEDLEALGLLKMDFLGLRNLSNIKKTILSIQKEDPQFEMPKKFNDQQTFHLLARGDTDGIFQLESPGMRRVLTSLKVNNFDDIASAIALYRPGPMAIIPKFIDRKLGKEKVTYPHPDLAPILENTYGTIVYQDQILLIAWKFAGYSLGQADILRRAVSKKERTVLENERTRFVSSSVNQGYSVDVAEEIYDYIVEFAEYGFNKAHSVAYAVIAYQTAYLKANYPKHYLATLMTSVIGSETLLNTYVNEARKKKIKVKPPLINDSYDYFQIEKDAIIFPLTAITGLGQAKAQSILQERAHGKFGNFEDFIIRTHNFLNSTLIDNIIYSGALDEFGLTKKAMIDNYGSIINKNQFAFLPNLITTNYTGEEFNYGTLLEAEKRVLGINLQYNFFYQFQDLYRNPRLMKINNLVPGLDTGVLGILKRIQEITTKNNEKMAFGLIQDDSAEVELVIFPKIYEQFYPFVHNQVIEAYGRVEEDKGKIKIIVQEIIKR